MFGGITESDLDTSSSEDDDDDDDSSVSSRPSSPGSPSGFNTRETNHKDGPTQDILKKCLEMLNSDISDTETQPQPDVDRDSMSSASSNFSIDIKAELGDQEKFDKLSVKTTSPLCEGLLKIASPVPPLPLPPAQPSVTKAHVTPPSPSPSPTPSSGPP